MSAINVQNIFNHPVLKKFLKINAHKILYHNASFYYLSSWYSDNPQFLNEWQEVLITADPDYKSNHKLSLVEYLYQLLPVIFTSLTAFFGLLLGLSNLPVFSDLMGNFNVVEIFFMITLIAVIVSTFIVYRQIRFSEQRATFTNWFFLGLIYYVSFFEIHSTIDNNVYLATKELQDYYQELHNQLFNNKPLSSTEILKNKLLKITQSSLYSFNANSLAQLSDFFKIEVAVHENIGFEHHEFTIQKPSSKIKLVEILGKNWIKLKQLVTRYSLIWEITIGNIAMSAGLVGVTTGTVKAYAHYFKKESLSALIMSPTVTIITLIVMTFVMTTHFYCRIKGQKFYAARKKMFDQQIIILNDCFQIVHNLKKLDSTTEINLN